MADTAALQMAFEWVRGELSRRHGVDFSRASVRLVTGATRTFNAVAADGTVVATITNSSGLTSGGKKPVAKLRGAEAELYFLSLVDAPQRFLIATDDEFLSLLRKELDGALALGLSLRHIALPPEISATVARVTRAARREMDG